MAGKRVNRSKNTAVGYVRRSTDKQEQSIADQKKAIESYVQEQNLRLLQFYVDDAISGTSVTKRLAFQQMIKDAESANCRFSFVVVYDVKRFGRLDNDEAGYYRHRLKTHGVEILYVSENFNGDYTDDLLRPVKQWQARQESKDLSKVTIRGLLSKVETGAWMGGVPPYGYDLRYENANGEFLFTVRYMPDRTKQIIDENGKHTRTLSKDESIQVTKKDRAKLTPSDKARVEVINQIFDSYTNVGKGFKSIAATLNRNNIPTARGPQWARIYSGKWTASAVKYLIANPLYAGDMVWNRRTDARFHKISNGIAIDRKDIHGHRLVPNDESDWIIIRNSHPAIVDRKTYLKAQKLLDGKLASTEQRGVNPRRRHHGKTWEGKRSRFILSGIIFCSKCGCRYQGVTVQKGKINLDGTRSKNFYYACGGYINKGKSVCQKNSIPQDILEKTVVDALLRYYSRYLEEGGKELLIKAIKQQIKSQDQDIAKAITKSKDELARIESIINNLLDNLTSENRELVDQRLKQLNQQRKLLKNRIDELEHLENTQDQIATLTAKALKFLSSLKHIFNNGLPQEKLTTIRQCIKKIEIDKTCGRPNIQLRIVPVANLLNIDRLTINISRMSC